jgi:hypothetical protein
MVILYASSFFHATSVPDTVHIPAVHQEKEPFSINLPRVRGAMFLPDATGAPKYCGSHPQNSSAEFRLDG